MYGVIGRVRLLSPRSAQRGRQRGSPSTCYDFLYEIKTATYADAQS